MKRIKFSLFSFELSDSDPKLYVRPMVYNSDGYQLADFDGTSKEERIEYFMDRLVKVIPIVGPLWVRSETLPDLSDNERRQFQFLDHEIEAAMLEYGYLNLGNPNDYMRPVDPVGRTAKKAGGHFAYQRLLQAQTQLPYTTIDNSKTVYNFATGNGQINSESPRASQMQVPTTNKRGLLDKVIEFGKMLIKLWPLLAAGAVYFGWQLACKKVPDSHPQSKANIKTNDTNTRQNKDSERTANYHNK